MHHFLAPMVDWIL